MSYCLVTTCSSVLLSGVFFKNGVKIFVFLSIYFSFQKISHIEINCLYLIKLKTFKMKHPLIINYQMFFFINMQRVTTGTVTWEQCFWPLLSTATPSSHRQPNHPYSPNNQRIYLMWRLNINFIKQLWWWLGNIADSLSVRFRTWDHCLSGLEHCQWANTYPVQIVHSRYANQQYNLKCERNNLKTPIIAFV